jgi:putative transposase
VALMCRVLGVSVSGYYAWRKRAPSRRTQANAQLSEQIRQVHRESRGTYGSPRIHAELRARGCRCNHKRIARLMRLQQIRGKCRRRKRVVTTDANHDLPVAANLLDQHFVATAPNQKWLADITYLPTQEGWLYLAGVLDLFSRKFVGWAMAATMTTELVSQALQMALQTRKPGSGLLHHSDRGSQYVSRDYQTLLKTHHMVVSMSRTGNCYDNAVMESAWGTLKTELADDAGQLLWSTRQQAKSNVFWYLEGFYNRHRRHSALGYLSPEQFEQQFFDSQHAATYAAGLAASGERAAASQR